MLVSGNGIPCAPLTGGGRPAALVGRTATRASLALVSPCAASLFLGVLRSLLGFLGPARRCLVLSRWGVLRFPAPGRDSESRTNQVLNDVASRRLASLRISSISALFQMLWRSATTPESSDFRGREGPRMLERSSFRCVMPKGPIFAQSCGFPKRPTLQKLGLAMRCLPPKRTENMEVVPSSFFQPVSGSLRGARSAALALRCQRPRRTNGGSATRSTRNVLQVAFLCALATTLGKSGETPSCSGRTRDLAKRWRPWVADVGKTIGRARLQEFVDKCAMHRE